MSLLKGKVALVTGGAQGIGRSIVETFVANGAKVAFTYIGDDTIPLAFEKELAEKGAEVLAIPADASSLEDAQKSVDAVVEKFSALHIVVNNAGITQDNLLLRMTEEQWDRVININLKSVFNYSKVAIRPMMRQKEGVFINISSVVGLSGNAGQINYSASKAGILGVTFSVAKEFASRNIRSNAIAPGFILTQMTDHINEKERDAWMKDIPLQRAGTPEDVANACLFLASDLSSYITGQVIRVDGGMIVG